MEKKCAACGGSGEVRTSFQILRKKDHVYNCTGFGTGGICYDCVKKKLVRGPRATIITGIFFALFSLAFGMLPLFNILKDDITTLIIFACFALGLSFMIILLGRSSLKKVINECSNKILSDEVKEAAEAIARKHFRKTQQVPAENVDLNFESFWEKNKFSQIEFIFKTAPSNEEKAKIISSFLSGCTKQPIDGSKGKLAFYGLGSLSEGNASDFLPLVYKVHAITE
ncbi:MAG: hypothetical protein ACYCX2_05690 [Christensenellales bacterium]